jgi:hypothetical protein
MTTTLGVARDVRVKQMALNFFDKVKAQHEKDEWWTDVVEEKFIGARAAFSNMPTAMVFDQVQQALLFNLSPLRYITNTKLSDRVAFTCAFMESVQQMKLIIEKMPDPKPEVPESKLNHFMEEMQSCDPVYVAMVRKYINAFFDFTLGDMASAKVVLQKRLALLTVDHSANSTETHQDECQ